MTAIIIADIDNLQEQILDFLCRRSTVRLGNETQTLGQNISSHVLSRKLQLNLREKIVMQQLNINMG